MKLIITFLLACVSVSAMAQQAATVPFEKGLHYTEINPGYATNNKEKVVVYEFFGYMCPHCASFQTYMKAWHAKKPENVELVRIPVLFQPGWELFAKAYYTSESMGIIEKTHQAMFDAIHKKRVRFRSLDEIAQWYADEFGVDKGKFLSTAKSFMIDSKIRQSNNMMRKMGIRSTPSVVVNGKYLINGKAVGGPNGMLELATYLSGVEAQSMGL